MKDIKNKIVILGLLGIGLIILHAVTSQLSHQFIFGQGHQQRPIIAFVVLMGLAGVLYIIALELIRRNAIIMSTPKIIMFICVTALFMRLAYGSSNFIQETDPYRYIWDGQAIIQGVNPYQHSPQEAIQNNFKPASDAPITRDVYRRINHEGVKTIYPPLAQGLFALSQWFTPWKVIGWKWMVTLADCAIIGLLIAIFGRLNMPKAWIVLYAWSPLVIKEFSNSVHLDIFALLMLCIMIYALIRKWYMAAYVSLAAAVLIKLFAIILLPLLVVWQVNVHRRYLIKHILVFFGLIGLTYLPFLNAGLFVTEGLGRFLSEWQTNDGLFSLIYWAVTHVPFSANTQMLTSRIVTGFILCIGVAVVSLRLGKHKNIEALLKSMGATIAILFFLLPTGNPWYYTWVLLFVPFLPLRALVLFSVLVFGYYLDFYFTYHGSQSTFVFFRWVEYGTFFLFLGGELWRQQRLSLSRS